MLFRNFVILLICFFSTFSIADHSSLVGYISSLSTVSASFLQDNPDGTSTTGFLRISFPGKLRIDYDIPNAVIFLNNNLIVYHDRQLEETTNIFIGKNDPVFALIKNPTKISPQEVKETQNFLDVVRSNEEKKCTLRLLKNPMKFFSLIVEDENGEITTLKFYDIKYNQSIDKKIFTEF